MSGSPGQYTQLQNPTKQEGQILAKYSSSKYLPNGSSNGSISFPFVNINNTLLFSGASYDPQTLAGLSWTAISGGLSDPTNPVTQAILTTGNYMSAGICQATHGQPGSVCTSSGVQAAAKALGSRPAEPGDDPCPPCGGSRSPRCSCASTGSARRST